MEADSFIGLVAKWLFGIDPAVISWKHVALALVMVSPAWVTGLIRLVWYLVHMRFLRSATPQQLDAYRRNQPRPPTIVGPFIVFWFLLGVGFLTASSRAGQMAESDAASAKSPCPGGCPAGSTCNPKTKACEAAAARPGHGAARSSRNMESTITKAAPLGADLAHDRYYEVNANPADYFDGSPES